MKSDGATRWISVPPKVERVERAETILDWEQLGIPIGLAFFVKEAQKIIARYPSPAGSIAREVPNEPAFDALAPQIEALLVSKLRGGTTAYLVSIDRAYELAGLIKTRWSGISGGEALERAVDEFFANLARETAHA